MDNFLRGLVAPLRGAAFVARHKLWWYLLLPAVINLALISGALVLAVQLVRPRLGIDLLAGVPSALVWALIVLISAVVALVLFIVVQPVVGAPFVDALTERTEALVRGSHPRVGLLSSSWWAVAHGLLKAACYAVALLLTLALSAVAGFLGTAVGAAATALFLAFDGFDYPLARRNVGFAGKWRYLKLHAGQTLGYCVGVTLLYLIPLAILVAPSFAAVGATLAYLQTDSHSAPGGRALASSPAADGRATSV